MAIDCLSRRTILLDILARSEGRWRRESDLRVLIVEDESLIALDIEAALLADGHQVVGIATNEREALELANEADLAFVDVKLTDGLSGPLIGKKLEKGFGVAVIYVTGNPALIGENLQTFDVVTKPHTREKIIETLRLKAARLRAGSTPEA
jgi:DNA-binding response OmpR family regulator